MQERKSRFTSLSGLDINRAYSRDDLRCWSPEHDLGLPGEFPCTPGVYPTMYRGRHWTMRQFAGFGSADDTNGRFKYLLRHGQNGLSVTLAVPFEHHRYYGEEIAAYVVPRAGDSPLTEADLLEHCRRLLPSSKCSKIILFGQEVPHTSIGKPKHLELKTRRASTLAAYRDHQVQA